MSAPLPQSLAAPNQRPPAGHAGLWFDKFCHVWSAEWQVDSPAKLDWIRTVTGHKIGSEELIREYATRAAALVRAAGGQTLYFKTTSRFATGLGREHPIENGFVWHPVLGVPYLPGSSVKGLVHAWARTWIGADPAAVSRIFGGERSEHIGSVIFHDVLPTQPIKLQADVMTPHYGPYYEDKSGQTAPGDWHSPVPIPFLAVADAQPFLFALSPRTRSAQDEADCRQAAEWLKDALIELGAGAKTSVGYGRFVPDREAEAALKKAEETAAKAAREAEEKAAFEAGLANLSPLARELRKYARDQQWETNSAAFKQQGVREQWMARLEADPQPDAIKFFGELIEKHDKGILQDPDRKEGKKNKPAYKETSIAIAKRWLALSKP